MSTDGEYAHDEDHHIGELRARFAEEFAGLRRDVSKLIAERDEARAHADAEHVRLQLQIGVSAAFKAERDRLRAALEPTAENIAVVAMGVTTLAGPWSRMGNVRAVLAAIRARAGLP